MHYIGICFSVTWTMSIKCKIKKKNTQVLIKINTK